MFFHYLSVVKTVATFNIKGQNNECFWVYSKALAQCIISIKICQVHSRGMQPLPQITCTVRAANVLEKSNHAIIIIKLTFKVMDRLRQQIKPNSLVSYSLTLLKNKKNKKNKRFGLLQSVDKTDRKKNQKYSRQNTEH